MKLIFRGLDLSEENRERVQFSELSSNFFVVVVVKRGISQSLPAI